MMNDTKFAPFLSESHSQMISDDGIFFAHPVGWVVNGLAKNCNHYLFGISIASANKLRLINLFAK